MKDSNPKPVYLFGPFRFDPDQASLRRGESEFSLRPKELALLEYFVQRPGRLLKKQAILDAVWGQGVHVSENALAQQVSQLRLKLGSEGESHIQTKEGLGYRFDAADLREAVQQPGETVGTTQLSPAREPATDDEPEGPTPFPKAIPTRPRIPRLSRTRWLGAAAVATVIVGIGVVWMVPNPQFEIVLEPGLFSTQPSDTQGETHDEFILDLHFKSIPGLSENDGVDLSQYGVEFTFQVSGEASYVQLWYKGRQWASIYSKEYLINSGKPIRHDPSREGAAIDQIKDYSHIWAVGAKLIGTDARSVRLTSAKLVRRTSWLDVLYVF